MALKAPDRPPAPKAKAPTPKTVTAVTVDQRIASREEGVQGVFQLASFGCMLKGWIADAGAIAKHGPGIAREVAKVAESNESVAKGIDFLTMVGPYGALLSAALPLGLQLLANRGIVQAAQVAGMGVVEPGTLENEVKAELIRQELAARRNAEAAEQELAAELMAAAERQQRGESRDYASAA